MAGVPYQGRVAWTTKSSRADRQSAKRRGVAVHWPGFRFSLGRHVDCIALVARLDREAQGNGYTAIPYNELACPHGYRIEGRGVNRRSGANGDLDINITFGSVCALVGVGARPTDAMLLAIHASLHAQAPGGRLVTHRAIRPESTACPGPALTTWISKGAPKPPGTDRLRHTVAEGDTLWKLAERYYGNGAKWPKIADANDLRGTDLALGDRIVIP